MLESGRAASYVVAPLRRLRYVSPVLRWAVGELQREKFVGGQGGRGMGQVARGRDAWPGGYGGNDCLRSFGGGAEYGGEGVGGDCSVEELTECGVGCRFDGQLVRI